MDFRNTKTVDSLITPMKSEKGDITSAFSIQRYKNYTSG